MYYPRLIEEAIALKLKSSGAVVVAGPKFCGKTTTCMLYQYYVHAVPEEFRETEHETSYCYGQDEPEGSAGRG